MPKSDLVQVYYLNQDEVCERPYQTITREEARQQKKDGKGWFICHGAKFRLQIRVPVIQIRQDRQRPTVNSCCGISKAEMMANAGVVNRDVPDLQILKAQEKVKAYPFVHDKLAVLASGYWKYT